MTGRRRISATTPLRDCPESSVGLAFSAPISDRLDALVSLAEANGDRTNRKELLASLILAAPSATHALVDTLGKYRQTSAGEARLDGQNTDTALTVSPRRPGPRPRKRLVR